MYRFDVFGRHRWFRELVVLCGSDAAVAFVADYCLLLRGKAAGYPIVQAPQAVLLGASPDIDTLLPARCRVAWGQVTVLLV